MRALTSWRGGDAATYAVYLRGDIDTSSKYYDRPAWMHKEH